MSTPRVLRAVAVASLLTMTLAACSTNDPTIGPTPPPPTETTPPWEPLLAPAADAGTGDIAFAAEKRFAGNFAFRLWFED